MKETNVKNEPVKNYSDSELIALHLQGRDDAFVELYERHKRRLYGFLNALLPWAPDEVDDIFQKTWLKVLKNLPGYEEQGYFSAWLFRVGRNILIDHQRSKGRGAAMVPLDDGDSPEYGGSDNEPWREMADADRQRLLRRAMESLPPEQREVVNLRNEGKSFKEIAAIQNCPLNTALARMQYALKNLKGLIANE